MFTILLYNHFQQDLKIVLNFKKKYQGAFSDSPYGFKQI